MAAHGGRFNIVNEGTGASKNARMKERKKGKEREKEKERERKSSCPLAIFLAALTPPPPSILYP